MTNTIRGRRAAALGGQALEERLEDDRARAERDALHHAAAIERVGREHPGRIGERRHDDSFEAETLEIEAAGGELVTPT
jgi:hypothetical protein